MRRLFNQLHLGLVSLLAAALWVAAPHGNALGDEGRPPGQPEKIFVSVAILDIDAVSSVDQSFTANIYVKFRWHDPALAHDGEGPVRRKLSEIFAPRFLLVNRQRTWSSLLNVVDISPEGEAVYRMRLWGDFSQPLRLHDFPFDDHDFKIPILAIADGGSAVPLEQDTEETSLIASELSVADWRVTRWAGESDRVEISRDAAGQGFVFSFHAERIYNHYVIKFIIPLILIVMMSWVVFWIDPQESSSQLSVAMTAALTLIAYHIALAGKLPDIPYLTRMDLFLFGSTLLVFSALLEVVLTSRLANGGHLVLARRMDLGCRILFPVVYVVMAGYSLGDPLAIVAAIQQSFSLDA